MHSEMLDEAGDRERAVSLESRSSEEKRLMVLSFVRTSISTPRAVESTKSTSARSITSRSGCSDASVRSTARTSGAL